MAKNQRILIPQTDEGWERRRRPGVMGKWELQFDIPLLVKLKYEGICSDMVIFSNEMAGSGVTLHVIDPDNPKEKRHSCTLMSKEHYFVWKHDVELIKSIFDHAVGKEGWIIESIIDGVFDGLGITLAKSGEVVPTCIIGGVYTGGTIKRRRSEKKYGKDMGRKVYYDNFPNAADPEFLVTHDALKDNKEFAILAGSNIPHKSFGELKWDGSWGLGETPKVILPARVNLHCIGKVLGDTAWLFRNQIEPTEGDIYFTQPFREYYIVWCDWTEFCEEIFLVQDKDVWVREGYRLLPGGLLGEISNVERVDTNERIHVAEIASLLPQDEYPEDYEWYTRFMKDEFKEKYLTKEIKA